MGESDMVGGIIPASNVDCSNESPHPSAGQALSLQDRCDQVEPKWKDDISG